MFGTVGLSRIVTAALYLCALPLAGAPAAAAVLHPVGLVSWWPADGDALDIAGGNDGTPHDGVTYAPGMVGQAFSFNGQRAGIGVRDAENLKITGSLSISAWILVASFPAGGSAGNILFRGDGRAALDPYVLDAAADGTVQFHLESLTKQANLYAPVPKGQFFHVAATFDANIGLMRIYVNGALAAQTITDAIPFRDLDPSFNPGVGIGNHSGLPKPPLNYPFHGLIDELQLYNRALSASEVQAIFSAGAAHRKAAAIEITVEPGSPRHIVDLRNSAIPVAILSAPWFNAPRQVDPNSLTFGATGDERSLILSQVREEDVNGDGLPDLVCEFRTSEAGFRLNDTEAVLKGATTDGGTIVGANPVLLVTAQ